MFTNQTLKEFSHTLQNKVIMKAIIDNLWDSPTEIITTENSDTDITTWKDLERCDNVIVEKPEKGQPFRTVLVGEQLFEERNSFLE